MEDVVLVHIAEWVSDAWERVVVAVGTAQTSTDRDVETLCS